MWHLPVLNFDVGHAEMFIPLMLFLVDSGIKSSFLRCYSCAVIIIFGVKTIFL